MSLAIPPYSPMPSNSILGNQMEATRLPTSSDETRGFRDMLMDALSETNRLESDAQSSIAAGLTGGDLTTAEVMASARKSDLALRLMIQVRNKLVDAYREVQQMRM